MQAVLYNCLSDDHTLNKQLTGGVTFDFIFKDKSDITKPIIIIRTSTDITGYNYVKIPEFDRAYWCTVETWHENEYVLSCECDVLESFKSDILNTPVLVEKSETVGINKYLPGDIFKNTVKFKTDILTFPLGLNENGSFILITAGG